jgi:transcriptional regulator GlxA family with amidase domain
MFRARATAAVLCSLATASGTLAAGPQPPPDSAAEPRVRQALFVVAQGVYNSELMAPYDVLQHTVFRDPAGYVQTAIVSADGGSVTTFEGITVEAHHSFADAPRADILVIPSTEGSMSDDLQDEAYMAWVRKAVAEAEWVITVCDGAFPLAATGALDGRVATTFPGDRQRLAEMYREVDVRHDVRLVVDGKFITSVGGGMSYEPAFWLVEKLYGREHALATARGLVWPWDLETVPHLVVADR